MKDEELIGVARRLQVILKEFLELEVDTVPAILRKHKLEEINDVICFLFNNREANLNNSIENIKTFLILHGESELADSIETLGKEVSRWCSH